MTVGRHMVKKPKSCANDVHMKLKCYLKMLQTQTQKDMVQLLSNPILGSAGLNLYLIIFLFLHF